MMNKLRSRSVGLFALGVATIAGFSLGLAPAVHALPSVGGITTTQIACGPLGANVAVNITGGVPNTTYVVGGGLSLTTLPAAITTNVSGSGSGMITSVPLPLGGLGNVTLPVSIGGNQVTTTGATIDCPTIL